MPTDLPALVIGGPTASGKTALALEIAARVGGEIINADAFQLYKGLPLLTAQPAPEELAAVPHHLVAEFALSESFDAARYAHLAREKIRSVRASGRIPILVGGTGLYVQTVLRGLSPGLPGPDAALRLQLDASPLEELTARLAELDPIAMQNVDLQNPRRVVRALEVCLLTGRPFSSFRQPKPAAEPQRGIWIQWPRDVLHHRIAERANRLFPGGVAEEVRAALPTIGATARQVIGLSEVAAVLEGGSTIRDAVEKIIAATRQYARRQETWFRKETALSATAPEAAVEAALRVLSLDAKSPEGASF